MQKCFSCGQPSWSLEKKDHSAFYKGAILDTDAAAVDELQALSLWSWHLGGGENEHRLIIVYILCCQHSEAKQSRLQGCWFLFHFFFGVTIFILLMIHLWQKKKFDHLIDMHLMIWNSWKWKPKKVRKRILPSRLSSASLQHGRHFEKMRNLNDRVSGFHHHGLH